ncbi:MAG: Gfo/Idh/MocA family oxidoreductase [Acidobacteriota bacterium]|nr:Gfo/Idh/MocA family oxidoreductase [Acidobacteriota bacterium]
MHAADGGSDGQPRRDSGEAALGRPAGAPVRVVVAGAGAFGRNHLRVYRELEQAGYPVELAAAIDPSATARAAVASEYGVPAFASVGDCMEAARQNLQRIHAASVCVPTVHHAEVAVELLGCGFDLLIEKPLAATLEQADAILNAAATRRRIVQPGHLERFNPAVAAARPLITRPMFFEVHRLSVFTPRSLDVDVVLDLMIHDLDVVMSLVRSPVREVRAVGLPVLSPKVDIANVRLEFENGSIANFTASRVSTERVRKMRFFQPHQYLSLDFARQDLLLIDVSAAAGLDAEQLAAMGGASVGAAGQHPSPGLSLRKVPVTPGEPLRLEIESFLDCVRERRQPEVTAHQGRAALALALEINAAIASHTARTGL